MEIARTQGKDLDLQSYAELRELIDMLGDIIHYFDSYKRHLFNLRRLVKDARHLKRSVTYAKRKSSGIEVIDALYARTSDAMLLGFFAYTPFLWVIIVQVVASILAYTGVQLFGRAASQLDDFVSWSRPQVDGGVTGLHLKKPFGL